MADLKTAAELSAVSQDNLVVFLQTDVETCSTFANIVETELSLDMEHARAAFAKAERGCEVIEHFTARVQDEAQRVQIEQSLTLLRLRLDALEAKNLSLHKG